MPVKPVLARFRRIRPELLLLPASIAVSLLLAEVGLRVHYAVTYSGTLEDLKADLPAPGSDVTFGDVIMVSAYPRLLYQFKPNLEGVRYKGAGLSTNSQGFRELSEPDSRDERTVRIVGLGDSVMFGLGVEENERYMDVLEERLNREFPAVRWETITLAAPGYNLVTEVEALERYGLAYEPELVIYGFIFNDFCLPNFVSRRQPIWSANSFIRYYWQNSGAGDFLLHRQYAALDDQGVAPSDLKSQDADLFSQSYCKVENFPPEYQHLVGKKNFQLALGSLAEIGRRRGFATVFFSYGAARGAGQISLPEDVIGIDLRRLYRRYLRRNGYRTLTESDLVLSVDDLHPSAKGHRMIGAALAEKLAERGLIEEILARKAEGP